MQSTELRDASFFKMKGGTRGQNIAKSQSSRVRTAVRLAAKSLVYVNPGSLEYLHQVKLWSLAFF